MEADSRRSHLLTADEKQQHGPGEDTSRSSVFSDNDSSKKKPYDDVETTNTAPDSTHTTAPANYWGAAAIAAAAVQIPKTVQPFLASIGGTTAGLCAVGATFLLLGLFVFPTADQEVPSLRIAFLGNSMTFVNDLPRVMEALSSHKITQNSCLHGSLNFNTMLSRGNGMYNKWQTENAVLDVISVETDDYYDYAEDSDDSVDDAYSEASSSATATTTTHTIYDFGACSFPQLLFGYDAALSNGNENSFYSNDGMNPCFQDPYYLDYLNDQYYQSQQQQPVWDYVVMNDQTIYPGVVKRRRRSLRVLRQAYADLLAETGGAPVPVLLSTYGYDKDLYTDDDSDDDKAASYYSILGDIPEFTSRVWYGYQQYAAALQELLPPAQQPIVVPSGLAFLTLWEENYDMWFLLFQDDGFHPTPHGTFLLGCCLYATLYGRMPPSQVAWISDAAVARLFANVRLFQMPKMGEDRPLPTAAEAGYLASVAERVVLKGHRPSTLLSLETVAALEAEEASQN